MAKNCYGRRLAELLQEQQEPFLIHGGGGEAVPRCSVAEACRRRLRGLCDHASLVGKRRGDSGGDAGTGRSASALRRVLCGRAVRRALRWKLAAGCFSCCAARQSFRRLPRRSGGFGVAVEFDEQDDDDSPGHGRQLSPVSVLELLSDKESPMPGEDDDKPSTSESSQPSDDDLACAASPCFTFYDGGKICAMQVQDKGKITTRCRPMEEQQMIISSWERIAGDISKIPMLVELDLTGALPERWRLGEEEVSLVGACIEAMIFEEIRGEAVLDMLLLA